MPELPPEYLDPNTPPEVVVTDRLRPSVEDPTLGSRPASRASRRPPPTPYTRSSPSATR